MSKTILKISFILVILALFVCSCVHATDVNMNLSNNTVNTTSTNNNSNSTTTEQSSNARTAANNQSSDSSQATSYNSSASVNLNSLPEAELGLTNILNIILIVLGVLLILLGIAIIIRLKK